MTETTQTITELLDGLDRADELTSAERESVEAALPDGHELVEGDFADDEKWRIVQTVEQPVDRTGETLPAIDYPVIGECFDCSEPIREGESRVEDHRGLWHPDHYQASA